MNIKLLRGDCLERMREIPRGSVDLVLTDPPYGMSFRSNYRNDRYSKILNDDSVSYLPTLITKIDRVMASDSAGYMFCSFHHIDSFKIEIERRFKFKNILVWEKNNTSMGDLKGDFAPKIEMVCLFTKGRPLLRGKRDPNIFRFNRTGNKIHPTQKPVGLMKYLISKFSDTGQTVFDPFMGSGSTGVACVNTGRNFVGIELDKKYYAVARDRIKEAYMKKKKEF